MAMFAAHWKLSNLIAFVDNNHLQIDGTTDEVCSLGNIRAKFEAFGWYVQNVNGHDVEALDAAIENACKQEAQPCMIVMDTIKGHGWSQAEGKVGCHSRNITPEDKQQVLQEMQQALDRIGGN